MRLGLGSKDWIDPVLIMDPLSFSAAGSPLVGPLEGGMVYKDVDGAERIDGFPGHSLGYGNARQCRRGGGRLCDRLR